MNLKNQSGYALLNVVLIFTIVTIFGISLIGMTLSSQKFTAYSENYTGNLAEAEMKMDESMIRLENEVNKLNNEVDLHTITAESLKSKMSNLISFLNNSDDDSHFTSDNIRTINSNDNRFSEMVTIKVKIGDSERYLTKTATITSAADIFRFSTVTEGKLIFNGAASIKGDIFANNGIYLSKYAKFVVNNYFYTPLTDYPVIEGNIMVKKATSLGLKFFEGKEPNWHPVKEMSTLNTYLPNTPAVKDRSVQFEQFNIQKIIIGKKQELDNKRNHASDYNNSSIKSSKVINNSAVFKNFLIVESDLTVKGDLTLEEGIILTSKGSLKVSGNVYIKNSKKQTNILSGNIDISNSENFIYIDGNTAISDLTVNSHIYNSGNVGIKQNLNMNGTIFVSGDSTIEDLSNKSGGTVVILSKGSLRISNNNVFQKTVREIDAFLYSDQDLEIYGVGSNIKINGGIYGKNITLNATKGETYPTTGYSSYNPNLNTSNFDSIGGLYLEKNQTNPNLPSRLQIEFEPDLIQNPPVGLPAVDKLQITEIDQKIE